VGIVGKSAVDLARDLLTHFGSLDALCAATCDAVCAVPGMGAAKFSQLQAALEMARRALSSELVVRDVFDAPDTVRRWLRLRLGDLGHEEFHVLLLDAQNRLIHAEALFRGTLTQTSVYPREVVKIAMQYNAAALLLAHNHPSGCAEPSSADHALTRSLRDALALVDIRVLDHFVVTRNQTVSFAESGWM